MLWDGRPHRFESLKSNRARIREASSAELREVSVAELRGLPSLPEPELDRRLEQLRETKTIAWTAAQQREAVIRDVMNAEGPTIPLVEQAAKNLGLSARSIRRLIARYQVSAQTTSLVAFRRGPKKTHRRLGAERERLIDVAIEKRYLVRPPTLRPTTVAAILVHTVSGARHTAGRSTPGSWVAKS